MTVWWDLLFLNQVFVNYVASQMFVSSRLLLHEDARQAGKSLPPNITKETTERWILLFSILTRCL